MKQKLWLIAGAVVLLSLIAGGAAWAASATAPVTQAPAAQAAEESLGDVVVNPTGRLAGHVVRGTETAATGDEVAVETPSGEIATLLITATTHLWLPGEPPTTTVELAAGDPVLAFGRPAETGDGGRALVARIVVVVSDQDLPKVLILGRATAVTQQTIVVQTRRGERAVTVLLRTRLWAPQGQLDSLRDVTPGMAIVALGQPTELGQWVAGLVIVAGPKAEARRNLNAP